MTMSRISYLCTLVCILFAAGEAVANLQHNDNVVHMSVQQDQEVDAAPQNKYEDTEQPGSFQNGEVKFSFAKHFQNNMVLQRAPVKANVYGFSPDIGHKVILQMNTPSKPFYYTTKVEASSTPGVGVWRFTLDPQEANITANIKVLSELGTLNLGNLIFGDVWLCGGQSNMQFSTSMMLGAEDEIADAHNYPNMRLMTVALKSSAKPIDDLIEIEQAWIQPTNASVGGKAWSYFSAVCWVYGKALHKELGVPIGLVASNWGGTPVEAWSSVDALKKCGLDDVINSDKDRKLTRLEGPDDSGSLYNSMIHPLLGMTIKGAVWYQGEADASGSRMNNYNCTFPAMINDWREKFSKASGQTDSKFPFGFVQLAANRPDPSIAVGFPDIRWHQTADVGFVPNSKMPNVFMAVSMDLPDYKSPYSPIHPRDKLDVGSRLALSGLAVAYGVKDVYQGPFPASGLSDGRLFNITFNSHITVNGKEGFEWLCHPSNLWQPTPIMSHNSTSLSLSATICRNETITGVRYAWRESPCDFKKCTLYGTTNMTLPVPPFMAKVQHPDERFAEFDTPTGKGVFNF